MPAKNVSNSEVSNTLQTMNRRIVSRQGNKQRQERINERINEGTRNTRFDLNEQKGINYLNLQHSLSPVLHRARLTVCLHLTSPVFLTLYHHHYHLDIHYIFVPAKTKKTKTTNGNYSKLFNLLNLLF